MIGGAVLRDPACFEYAAGSLVGVVLTPDLDVDAGNISYTMARRVRLETIWSALWHFYRSSIKHGSELSHFPVISTLGRLAYIFLFCVIIPNMILSWFGWNFDYETHWWANFVVSRWRMILALMGSDFIHYILDVATVNNKFNFWSLISRKTAYKRR